MLRSACCPCQLYRLSSQMWIRQDPRFFRFPVRFAGLRPYRTVFGSAPRAPRCLRSPAFTLTAPAVVPNDSRTRLAQSGLWDGFQARHRLCLPVGGCSSPRPCGFDRTPRSHAPWSGFRVAINPGALTSLRQASGLSSSSSQKFEDHRPVSMSTVETLECVFGTRTSPVTWVVTATPGAIASRCGRGSRFRSA